VADLYLNNIRKVKPPAGKSDVAGSCRQVKEVYRHVITLTTLEESEGCRSSLCLNTFIGTSF
jgi:hypothetical protein